MLKKKKKDWFKLKRYPHIGFPLNYNDRKRWIENYVTNPDKIACHSFLPFIHKSARVRKFRKEYDKSNGKLIKKHLGKNTLFRNESEKKRELFYAGHLDSLIYSYYSFLLSEKYEKKIEDSGLHDVVNAYRSVKINPLDINSSNKCNIDFANDVFQYISKYPEDKFTVIAFDITSFFDRLKHCKIREKWSELYGSKELPPDHFNVFKNITRFSHIDLVDIFEEFKDKIYTRKIDKFGKPLKIKRKRVDNIRYLKNQNAIAFCTKEEFFKLKGKLLQPSKTIIDDSGKSVPRNFGIPQGSPISSVLANIYLIDFDIKINTFINQYGGIYRRYSDDIVVVCPTNIKDALIDLVHAEIEECKLEIQQKKTQIFQFKRENGKLVCGQEYTGNVNWNKNFIYLGFEFDGERVLLKSASLSGFYRKMKRTIRRAKYFSHRKNTKTNGLIFKRRLLKKFSYKGAKRNRKWLWNERLKVFEKSDSYNWGNFLSYTKKASKVMMNNNIAKQTRRHWNILNQLIQ